MMNFRRNGKAIFGLATAALLSACSYGNVGPAENQVDSMSRDAARYVDMGRRPLVPENIDRVRVEDGIWTGAVARRNDRGSPIPRAWERPEGFVLKRATPMQIFEIGTAITEVTGIPVTFSPDVLSQNAAAAAAPVAGGPAGSAPAGDINSLLGGLGLGGGNPATTPSANAANVVGGQIRPVSGTRQAMRVDFQGRLSQFLNEIGAHFGISWEYGGGEIRMFRNVTRTYTVNALPSNINLNASLSADSSTQQAAGSQGGSAAGGATSSANQKVSSTTTIQIWDDITKNVEGIVGQQGKVTAAVSTGTITVTAPSSVIQHVQTYLDGQNERLGKQVTVNITVLSVELKDGDNTSVDIGGLFSNAGKYGLAFGTPAGVASGSTAIATLANAALGTATGAIPTAAQLNPLASSSLAAGGVGFNVANPRSSLNGSSLIAQALATKGRVSLRTNASVTTINGVPAPVQVANTRGYVQSVSVSDGTTTGSSTSTTRTSIQPGSVTTGFSMSLLPRIDPDGQAVLMQYNINLSELVGTVNGFETFTSPDGRATVQLPNVNSRNFVQQARVPNGATLVLTGFEQTSNNADRQGSFGDASFLGLGGHQTAQRNRTAIVVLMTPTVVSNQVITAE